MRCSFFLVLVGIHISTCLPVKAQNPSDSSMKMDATRSYSKALSLQCRSDILLNSGENPGQHIEKGFIGIFHGRRIFYEVWFVDGPVGTEANYILLRTDTTALDSFDICLPQVPEREDNFKRDTAVFMKADWNGAFYYDSSLNENNFPTLFQVLEYGVF